MQQFYALDSPVELSGPSGSGHARVWAEDLKALASDAKILLTYGKGNGWLSSHPAAIQHAYGKGQILYIGADLDPTLMSALVASVLQSASVRPIVPDLPSGMEVMERDSTGHRRLQIFVNHTDTVQPLTAALCPLRGRVHEDKRTPAKVPRPSTASTIQRGGRPADAVLTSERAS